MSEAAAFSRDVPALDEDGPQSTKATYGVACHGVDFGMLNARNQLITHCINPLIDKIMVPLKRDRALHNLTDSGVRYTVNVIVTAELDAETVQ